MTSVLFLEKQKFSQWWLWLLLIGLFSIPAFGMYKQFVPGIQTDQPPKSTAGLIFFTLFVLGVVVLFLVMQLQTEITKEAISFQFFPFVKRRIKWEEVKEVKLIDYGFVGGWGIRLGTKYGTVYNIAGRTGLYIELITGEQLVIGTQQEEKLQTALQKVKNKQA